MKNIAKFIKDNLIGVIVVGLIDYSYEYYVK